MTEPSPLWLVVNSASGSNDDAAIAALIATLRAGGRQPGRVIDCAREDLPGLADVEAAGIDVVAIFTGDGTLSTMVPRLEGWGGAVLALPGGTANLLARSLHGERDAADIVAAFSGGSLIPVRRPCIRFPGHVALVEVLAGPGATWSDVREGLRGGDVGEIATRTIEAVRQSAAGAMVSVIDPPLGDPGGYAGVRLAPTADGLLIDGYRADTVGDYLKQGLALLRRDFREGPHDGLGLHPAAVCRAAQGAPIELMIDGERATTGGEVAFTLSKLDVTLLGSTHG